MHWRRRHSAETGLEQNNQRQPDSRRPGSGTQKGRSKEPKGTVPFGTHTRSALGAERDCPLRNAGGRKGLSPSERKREKRIIILDHTVSNEVFLKKGGEAAFPPPMDALTLYN